MFPERWPLISRLCKPCGPGCRPSRYEEAPAQKAEVESNTGTGAEGKSLLQNIMVLPFPGHWPGAAVPMLLLRPSSACSPEDS